MSNCRETNVRMCGCLIYWSDILGDPSECKALADYLKKALGDNAGGDDNQNKLDIDLAELAKKVLALLEKGDNGIEIDPYKIKYKDTTVGDALDELRRVPLDGVINPDFIFEVGRRVRGLEVGWKFNKPLKELKIVVQQGGFPDIEKELDPETEKFELPEIISDTVTKVIGRDEDGSEVVLKNKINFKWRMYCGTRSGSKLTNKEILALDSYFFDREEKQHWVNLWNCQYGEYIYYLFPYEAQKFYNFYTNKMKDNNFVWEVIKVTNQYGKQHDYFKFRSNNLLTGIDILTEVIAHEIY